MKKVTGKGHPCIQIKKMFWVKSLIQSVRKIKPSPCWLLWDLDACYAVCTSADTWPELQRASLEFAKC